MSTKPPGPSSFPIDEVLGELLDAVSSRRNVLLQAEPGAGKTTRVPEALLLDPRISGRILVLEPRRIAALSAASYVAARLGESVGERIGFRVRGASRESKKTGVLFLTEGILTRMMQSDPLLEGIGCIVFDEFHERSIHSDLGLAIAREIQREVRPDLSLILMSATLDGEWLAERLGDARIITSKGKMFPVRTEYLGGYSLKSLPAHVTHAIRRAIEQEKGDILVFLPGLGEITRVRETLGSHTLSQEIVIASLHGDLPLESQREVLGVVPGRRKVVLSTSLAETSLTVEGVRVVIDCGLTRTSMFDPSRGMASLVTIPSSRASGDQRRGRAGRLSDGVCYRLWSEESDVSRRPFDDPEIVRGDVTQLLLELALWGDSRTERYSWVTPPPQGPLAVARELLVGIGALSDHGAITSLGREIAALPVHPRLGSMLVFAKRHFDSSSVQLLASRIAALLEERDPCPRDHRHADLSERLELLASFAEGTPLAPGAHRGVLSRALETSRRLRSLVDTQDSTMHCASGVLVSVAFPERIARRTGPEADTYLLASGTGAVLNAGDPLRRHEWLAVAECTGESPRAVIRLASPLSEEDIYRYHRQAIRSTTEISVIPEGWRVSIREREMLGAIPIRTRHLSPSPEQIRSAIAQHVKTEGIDSLPWTEEQRRLRARAAFLADSVEGFERYSLLALQRSWEEWLLPFLPEAQGTLPLIAALDQSLHTLAPFTLRRQLDELVPSHVEVPSGSRIPIAYQDSGPIISVRLQELFGMRETPRICGGRVAITVELLSPAFRPVQTTRDLESFWREGYFEVRKDLRSRYPKHAWPEDPLTAAAIRGPRRRSR